MTSTACARWLNWSYDATGAPAAAYNNQSPVGAHGVRQLEKFMRDITRLVASAFIWMMMAIILTSNTAASSNAVALAFILGIGATISTAAIWQSGTKSQNETTDEIEKHKRRSRVTRLMDEVDNKLDDEEVYELEELLASRRDEAMRRRSQ
jgi:hypothetical protein